MDFAKRVKDIFASTELVGAGCCVLKKEDDTYNIVNHYEVGVTNFETNSPISLDAIFRIASVSKMVVALAMMALVEKKVVSINTDISDILGYLVRNPFYPSHPITIKMLMTQTSSITDGPSDDSDSFQGYNGVNGHHFEVKLKDLLIPSINKYYTPLTWDNHEPGSTFIYSNFGCGILACLVEKLTNEHFINYVKRTILEPLNIDASFQASTIFEPDLIANLYYFNQNQFQLARSKDDFIKGVYPLFSLGDNFRGPAGGMFISLRGLTKVAELFLNRGMVNGKRVLQSETIDLMLTRHWQGEKFNYYAKGLQIRFLPYQGFLLKGHTGSAYGLSSLLFFHEESNSGLCFASNGGNFKTGAFGLNQIQEQLINAYVMSFLQKD